MEKLKSTKLWFNVALTIVFCTQLAQGLINGDQYVQLIMWVVIGFTGGNVGTKLVNKDKK